MTPDTHDDSMPLLHTEPVDEVTLGRGTETREATHTYDMV